MPGRALAVDVLGVKRRDPVGSTVASARPLFLVYAAVSLIPVLLLGVVLLNLMGRQATSRGLAEGQTEASLLAGSVISPTKRPCSTCAMAVLTMAAGMTIQAHSLSNSLEVLVIISFHLCAQNRSIGAFSIAHKGSTDN